MADPHLQQAVATPFFDASREQLYPARFHALSLPPKWAVRQLAKCSRSPRQRAEPNLRASAWQILAYLLGTADLEKRGVSLRLVTRNKLLGGVTTQSELKDVASAFTWTFHVSRRRSPATINFVDKETKMRNLFFLLAILVGGLLFFNGCAEKATPPQGGETPEQPPTEEREQPKEETKDIVDTAAAADDFTTLVAAVKAAELVDTLKGDGPFTVFAPTNDAFGKLPEGTLDDLLKPENKEKLTAILTYHVVPGKVMAADVVKVKSAKTVQGAEVAVTVEDGKVKVDGANVTATDIECSNGVIHIIDAVILPKDD